MMTLQHHRLACWINVGVSIKVNVRQVFSVWVRVRVCRSAYACTFVSSNMCDPARDFVHFWHRTDQIKPKLSIIYNPVERRWWLSNPETKSVAKPFSAHDLGHDLMVVTLSYIHQWTPTYSGCCADCKRYNHRLNVIDPYVVTSWSYLRYKFNSSSKCNSNYWWSRNMFHVYLRTGQFNIIFLYWCIFCHVLQSEIYIHICVKSLGQKQTCRQKQMKQT